MAAIEIKRSRLTFIYFCILAAFFIIILRLFFVVFLGDKIKVSGIYDLRKVSKRANIFDRNGVLVATDLKTKSLYLSNVLIKNPQAIAAGVSKIFPDLSYNEVLKKISEGRKSRQWTLLRRNLTPSQVDAVQNLQMAGLLFEDDRIRVYPQKSIASHYVGYVDLDRKGLSGIEMKYDRDLIDGQDINLALDVRVQDILNDELQNGLIEYNAKAAAGVVLDVTNGEILALSSLPSFDPNIQHEADSEQRFNRVTNGVYELGSVFKIFTNAQAFDDNLIKLSDTFDVSEPIKYGRFTIKDYHQYNGRMNIEEIFTHSSNIGTVHIAQKIGPENQKDFLEKMGLLKRLEVDFPGLGKPIYPKSWRDINLYTISYGHGLAITPLHLAIAGAAIVNGGTLYKPSFLKISGEPSGKRVIKESTSAVMRLLLRKTALDGTAKNADIEGYEVGGKTGTSNRAESGSYNETQTMASFVATFPISQPKYLVYIIFDRPNVAFNTGGMVAAPVAGKIIKNIAPIVGIRPLWEKEKK